MRLWPSGPKFGITLRGMLVITTLLAVGVALVGTKVKRARQERAAVDHILQMGGAVQIANYGTNTSLAPEERTWFEGLIGLDLESRVTGVTLSGPQVTDAELASLAPLSDLQHLRLLDTPVSGTGLAALDRLPKLQSVWIDNQKVDALTEEGVSAIASLPHVRSLTLKMPQQTASGHRWNATALAPLAAMSSLANLELSGMDFIDEDLRQLAGLSHLVSLRLSNTDLTDAGLQSIAEGMPELSQLSIEGGTISGAGLAKLKRCDNLVGLTVRGCAISDDDLAGVAELQQLTSLYLDDPSQLTDEGLRHIGGMVNLVRLDVVGARLTDEGVRHLAGLKSLTWLLMNSKSGQFTEAEPFELTHLTNLVLGPTALPQEAEDRLKDVMPNVTVSNLPRP